MEEKPMHGPKRRTSMVLALGLAMVLLMVSAFNVIRLRTRPSETTSASAVIPVAVRAAQIATMYEAVKTTGDLVPIQDVYLYPAVPGKKIQRVLFERGQTVPEGALVVQLDDAELQARLRQAEAAVSAARIQAELLEKDRARFENLYQQKAVARQKLDHIQAEHRAARARLEEAHAALKALQEIHRDFFLHSPIRGVLAERYVDPGNLSDVKKPVVRITDESVLKVVFYVPEKEISLLRSGLKGVCTLDAFPGQTFEGTVEVTAPVVDPRTRTILAELHLPNPQFVLRSGMFAHVTVPLRSRETLVVDRDALVRMPGTGRPYVFVVEEGKARMRNVRLGAEEERWVEVVEGIRLGEQVIVRGQNRVVDGSPVEITASETS